MRALMAIALVWLCVQGVGVQAQQQPAEKTLVIPEGGTSGEIKWADVKTPDVEIPLTIENVSPKDVADVTVEATDFGGPGGTRPATVTGDVIKALSRNGGRAKASIAATLPAAGVYRAVVSVRVAGKTEARVAIEVARVRAAAPIQIASVPAQIVDLAGPFASETQEFKTTIAGAGRAVRLDAPVVRLSEYRLKADDKAVTSPPPIEVSVTPAMPFDVGKADADGKVTPVNVSVMVKNITTPGRYDVSVAFGADAFDGSVTTVTFYARQSAWVAGVSILLGVLLSLWLRYYSVIGRPSLQNKRRGARLFHELDEHGTLTSADPHALALVQDVRRKLAEFWNGLSAAGKLTDADALKVYEAKVAALPQWFQLWKRLAEVRPASVAEPFRAKLLTAEGVLRDRNVALAGLQTQIAILDQMAPEIDAAIAKELNEQIDKLDAQLRLDGRFQTELAELATIKQSVAPPGAAVTVLATAAKSLDALQRRYFTRVAADLGGRIVVQPIGAGESWPGTLAAIKGNLEDVRRAESGSAAATAFGAALRLYLRAVIDGLRVDLAPRMVASQQKDEYIAINTALDAIGTQVDSGKVVEAWKKLDDQLTIYRNIRQRVGGSAMGALADAAAAALTGLGAAPSAAADVDIVTLAAGESNAAALQRPGAGAATARSQAAGDIITFVVILAAAVLAGLQVLWVGNLTWGGWPSILAAFLWGLAFDQFSHAGIAGLLKRT